MYTYTYVPFGALQWGQCQRMCMQGIIMFLSSMCTATYVLWWWSGEVIALINKKLGNHHQTSLNDRTSKERFSFCLSVLIDIHSYPFWSSLAWQNTWASTPKISEAATFAYVIWLSTWQVVTTNESIYTANTCPTEHASTSCSQECSLYLFFPTASMLEVTASFSTIMCIIQMALSEILVLKSGKHSKDIAHNAHTFSPVLMG